ncbi:hypothetical protein OH492_26820 [Vibrio chagasii]|nr:hypothetical protein [Vibrio chagasii]
MTAISTTTYLLVQQKVVDPSKYPITAFSVLPMLRHVRQYHKTVRFVDGQVSLLDAAEVVELKRFISE